MQQQNDFMTDETPAPTSPEAAPARAPTFQTVSRIIDLLESLSEADRRHVLQTVTTWFRLPVLGVATTPAVASPAASSTLAAQRENAAEEKFSNRPVQSVKDFIFEKAPETESERVACLAYYLTHFRDTPNFRNVEISNLNTEAAQRRLTNPAVAVGNSARDGFLVAAPKVGHKQMSALGERYVQLLPDREAAQQVRQRMAARRSRRKSSATDRDEAEGT